MENTWFYASTIFKEAMTNAVTSRPVTLTVGQNFPLRLWWFRRFMPKLFLRWTVDILVEAGADVFVSPIVF